MCICMYVGVKVWMSKCLNDCENKSVNVDWCVSTYFARQTATTATATATTI